MRQSAVRSTVSDLKSIIDAKMDESLPPFVYSIILATRLNQIAARLETLLDAPMRKTASAEIEAIRAIAAVIDTADLRL